MQGRCIIVMGVSGSGKSTVAAMIAQNLKAIFIEGDELHPQENIEKMQSNTPLTDDDRKAWLEKIHTLILQIVNGGKDCVVSCSALKRKYREILRFDIQNILFIYLKGSYEIIHQRLLKRQDHFMPINLLRSQFDNLEEPKNDEQDVITIHIAEDLNEEMEEIKSKINCCFEQ